MSRLTESSAFMTTMRIIAAITVALALIYAFILAGYGMAALHQWMFPGLQCVQAHDEFHQADGGHTVLICDKYVRR